jgi:hypothetical protein
MENIYFWIYGAAAQVFGGLSAILSIFLVYVLEWIQNSIEWSRKDLVNAMKGTSIENLNLDRQIKSAQKHVKEWTKDNFYKDRCPTITRAIKTIQRQRAKRRYLTKIFKKLLIRMLLIVGSSFLFLLLNNLLVEFYYQGLALSILFLTFCFCSLYQMYIFVKESLKRKEPEHLDK